MYLVNLEGWGIQECATLDAALLLAYQAMRRPGSMWRWVSASKDDDPTHLVNAIEYLSLNGEWVNAATGHQFYTRISISKE
jgi:hypothetical protein